MLIVEVGLMFLDWRWNIFRIIFFTFIFRDSHCTFTLDLSIKSSKESTEIVSLLKTENKVVEVG
jgi:hypothetical protein